MTRVSERAQVDVAIRLDHEMREGRVRQAHAQPRLGRILQGAAHDEADHIRVADHDLVGVARLLRRWTPADLAVCRLDPLAIAASIVVGGPVARRRVGEDGDGEGGPLCPCAEGCLVEAR